MERSGAELYLKTELELQVEAALAAVRAGEKIFYFAVSAVPAIGTAAVALIGLRGGPPSGDVNYIFHLSHAIKLAVSGLLFSAALIVLLSSQGLRYVRRTFVRAFRRCDELRERLHKMYEGGPDAGVSDQDAPEDDPSYHFRSVSTYANIALAIMMGCVMAALTFWLLVVALPGWRQNEPWIVLAAFFAAIGYGLGLQVWFVRCLLADDPSQPRGHPETVVSMHRCGAAALVLIGLNLGLSGFYWALSRSPSNLVSALIRDVSFMAAILIVLWLFLHGSSYREAWRCWGYPWPDGKLNRTYFNRCIKSQWGFGVMVVLAVAFFWSLRPVTPLRGPATVSMVFDRVTSDPSGRLLSGRTNLPPGTRIEASLFRGDVLLGRLECKVIGGAFEASAVNTLKEELLPGRYYTWSLVLTPAGQDGAVLYQIGGRGQNIVNASITDLQGDTRQAVRSAPPPLLPFSGTSVAATTPLPPGQAFLVIQQALQDHAPFEGAENRTILVFRQPLEVAPMPGPGSSPIPKQTLGLRDSGLGEKGVPALKAE